MTVNTVGIQTSVNCALPSTFTLNTSTTGNNLIQSTSAQGCSSTVTFNSSSSEQQYGVVPATNCGSQTSVDFRPVMFWFFHTNAQGQPEARGVFCQPTIGIYNIKATANLNNGSLANVTVLSGYTQPNNVTATQAFNGYVTQRSHHYSTRFMNNHEQGGFRHLILRHICPSSRDGHQLRNSRRHFAFCHTTAKWTSGSV